MWPILRRGSGRGVPHQLEDRLAERTQLQLAPVVRVAEEAAHLIGFVTSIVDLAGLWPSDHGGLVVALRLR
jgi:hypothetical protein